MKKSIRFLQAWRGREPGQTDDQLDFGVMWELVRRNIAEWADEATHEAEGAGKAAEPRRGQRHKSGPPR